MSIFLLVGCGSSGVEDDSTIDVDEVVVENNILNTISMFGSDNDAISKNYNELINTFSNSTGLTINHVAETATNEWSEQVLADFMSEANVPDVMFFFTGSYVEDIILANKFVSIEEIRQEYPDYAGNIRPTTMEYMKEFDNKHYAVPVKGFWEGLYCNVDLFEKYRLELPTDWQSLITAIRKFNNNGIIPISASLKDCPNYWIDNIILSSGGAYSHQLSPYTYVPETWVEGLQKFVDMYAINSFSPNALEISGEEALDEFVNKESAMILEGSWVVGNIIDTENTVVLPVPSFNGGTDVKSTDIISGFSSGFYISREAWNDLSRRENAVEFVMYMTSDNAIEKICEDGGIPASSINIPDGISALGASVNKLKFEAENSLMPIDHTMEKEAWIYFTESVEGLLLDEITPREVLEKVSELNHL